MATPLGNKEIFISSILRGFQAYFLRITLLQYRPPSYHEKKKEKKKHAKNVFRKNIVSPYPLLLDASFSFSSNKEAGSKTSLGIQEPLKIPKERQEMRMIR